MKKAELVKKCQERMKSIRDKNYFTLRFGKTKKEIEQAKEMEKEKIVKAHSNGWNKGIQNEWVNSQEYYNETFKSE
jgi:hypothetical protein